MKLKQVGKSIQKIYLRMQSISKTQYKIGKLCLRDKDLQLKVGYVDKERDNRLLYIYK